MFDFSGRSLDLTYPHVMGVLNVTPDSFSDGGELFDSATGKVNLSTTLGRAEAMLNAGAVILDVGGESTRPGAREVSSQEEIDRVLPVVEAISQNLDIIISVDTSNPELIKLCAEKGVGLINDVRALSRPGALQAAADSGLAVCLMHMQGQPGTMQDTPAYESIVAEISDFLIEGVKKCENAGISRSKIILDPGFGFGKSLTHNIELLSRLDQLDDLGLPLLIGVSRKRMLGAITSRAEKDRVAGGLAAAVIAVMQGARLIRSHDVNETVDAMKICTEVIKARGAR